MKEEIKITKQQVDYAGRKIDYNLVEIKTIGNFRHAHIVIKDKPYYFLLIVFGIYIAILGFLVYMAFCDLFNLVFIPIIAFMYWIDPFLLFQLKYFLKKENRKVYTILVSKDCKDFDRVLEHELLHLKINELSLISKDWKELNWGFNEILEEVTLTAMRKKDETAN